MKVAPFDESFRDGQLVEIRVHPEPDAWPEVRYIEREECDPFCVVTIQGFSLFLTPAQAMRLAERLTVELAHLVGREEVAAR